MINYELPPKTPELNQPKVEYVKIAEVARTANLTLQVCKVESLENLNRSMKETEIADGKYNISFNCYRKIGVIPDDELVLERTINIKDSKAGKKMIIEYLSRLNINSVTLKSYEPVIGKDSDTITEIIFEKVLDGSIIIKKTTSL